MTKVDAVHPNAVAVSAFRILPNGEGRAYTISEAPSGRQAIERSVRMAQAVGNIEPSSTKGYAVLDILDATDGIVQDYCIPTAKAWRWWKRKLHLYVQPESTPAEVPHA